MRTLAVAIRSPRPLCKGITDSHDQSADRSRNDIVIHKVCVGSNASVRPSLLLSPAPLLQGLGIQLRVPVFDGFEKRSKIRKAKIEEENARIGYEDALKGLQANYMNAVSEVNNSQRNYKKQFDNYTMAQDVYNVTADQYKEGVASMTAVLQDEMRMSEAMNNYLTAYYRYKVANLSLLKLTGQLNQISVAK